MNLGGFFVGYEVFFDQPARQYTSSFNLYDRRRIKNFRYFFGYTQNYLVCCFERSDSIQDIRTV